LNAQEQIVTLQMHVTDPNAKVGSAGSTATFMVTSHVWIAPDPPEVKAMHDFDDRMRLRMQSEMDLASFRSAAAAGDASSRAGMAMLFGGHPGTSEAMAQMDQEVAKLKGTHVLEITTMGGSGIAAPGSSDASSSGASASTTGAPKTISATLMEQTHQLSNFSSEAIPMSVFEVPAGYKQLPNPFERGRQ
jgi:hypothetical protein